MTRRMGVAHIKAHLAKVLREVESRGERVIIERRGQAIAVIQPYDSGLFLVERHWAEELDGIAGDITDFNEIMEEIVMSRPPALPRVVDFDEEE